MEKMNMTSLRIVLLASVAIVLLPTTTYAGLLDGDFSNGLTGWTVTNNGAARPIAVASGTTTTSAGTIQPSLTSDSYVYTSQTGAGNSILSQSFTVASGVNKVFFDVAINNNAGAFTTLNSLSYSGSANQQARFDILKPGASLTSMNASDIIVTAYQTQPGDSRHQTWVRNSVDVSSQLAPYVGQNVIFRFAQVDNQGYFNMAIDNVNVGSNQFVFGNASDWTSVGIAGGGRAVPVGPVLDSISANGDLSNELALLNVLPTSSQFHAMKQLSVATLTPSALTTGATFTPSNVAIDTHLQTVVADASTGKNMAAGNAYQKGAIWGEVLGNTTSLNSSSSGSGFTSTAAGLLFGADTFISDDSVLGMAFNWLRGSAKGKDDASGNSSITDTYQLNLYGSWRPDGDPLWVQGLTSFGYNQYEQKRGIDYLGEVASASYHGLQMQVKATAGYDFLIDDVEGMTLAPVASLGFSRVQNGSYTETGSSVNQWVKGHGFNNVNSVVGGKVTQKFATDVGPVTVDFQAGWSHDYINSPITTTAVLQGVSYGVSTSRLPAEGAKLNLGANIQQSDDLSVRVEYEGDIRTGYASHTGVLKIRQSF